MAGFGKIKRDDPVVFNFPAGDTVVVQHQNVSYYQLVRDAAMSLEIRDRNAGRPLKTGHEYYALGRKEIWNQYDIVIRPVDKRDNYIKRCVAIPGDTLQIIQGKSIYQRKSRRRKLQGYNMNTMCW